MNSSAPVHSRSIENVWDYPRPPRLEPSRRHLRVLNGGKELADTRHGFRVLETSHPPVYYFPPADVDLSALVECDRKSFCEWKGFAFYLALAEQPQIAVAWHFPKPAGDFIGLARFIAFFASRVDHCEVDGQRVLAQTGGFYGGWITPDLQGPFKGGPGTQSW